MAYNKVQHYVVKLPAWRRRVLLIVVLLGFAALFGAVESVMLIPGSLGETKKSREPAAALAATNPPPRPC